MYRGLGVEPATIATAISVGKKIVSWISGENPDIPEGWVERAYSGAATTCEAGVAERDAASAGAGIRELFPDWRRGRRVYYPKARIAEVLSRTPQGLPGDALGTREALVGAIRMGENMRGPRSLSELVNMTAYFAHGRGDCEVGWREEPAVEHLERIMRRYAGSDGSGGSGGAGAPAASPSPALAIATMLGLVLVLRG